jgi:hypothetical protein
MNLDLLTFTTDLESKAAVRLGLTPLCDVNAANGKYKEGSTDDIFEKASFKSFRVKKLQTEY